MLQGKYARGILVIVAVCLFAAGWFARSQVPGPYAMSVYGTDGRLPMVVVIDTRSGEIWAEGNWSARDGGMWRLGAPRAPIDPGSM